MRGKNSKAAMTLRAMADKIQALSNSLEWDFTVLIDKYQDQIEELNRTMMSDDNLQELADDVLKQLNSAEVAEWSEEERQGLQQFHDDLESRLYGYGHNICHVRGGTHWRLTVDPVLPVDPESEEAESEEEGENGETLQ